VLIILLINTLIILIGSVVIVISASAVDESRSVRVACLNVIEIYDISVLHVDRRGVLWTPCSLVLS